MFLEPSNNFLQEASKVSLRVKADMKSIRSNDKASKSIAFKPLVQMVLSTLWLGCSCWVEKITGR